MYLLRGRLESVAMFAWLLASLPSKGLDQAFAGGAELCGEQVDGGIVSVRVALQAADGTCPDASACGKFGLGQSFLAAQSCQPGHGHTTRGGTLRLTGMRLDQFGALFHDTPHHKELPAHQ